MFIYFKILSKAMNTLIYNDVCLIFNFICLCLLLLFGGWSNKNSLILLNSIYSVAGKTNKIEKKREFYAKHVFDKVDFGVTLKK